MKDIILFYTNYSLDFAGQKAEGQIRVTFSVLIDLAE